MNRLQTLLLNSSCAAAPWGDARRLDGGGRPNPVLMPVLLAALRVVVNQWTPHRTVRPCRKTVPVLFRM